jgi:hypothetical protein
LSLICHVAFLAVCHTPFHCSNLFLYLILLRSPSCRYCKQAFIVHDGCFRCVVTPCTWFGEMHIIISSSSSNMQGSTLEHLVSIIKVTMKLDDNVCILFLHSTDTKSQILFKLCFNCMLQLSGRLVCLIKKLLGYIAIT